MKDYYQESTFEDLSDPPEPKGDPVEVNIFANAYQLDILFTCVRFMFMNQCKGNFIVEVRRPQEIIYIHVMIIFQCGASHLPRRLKFEDCKQSHASDYLRIGKNAV